MKTRTLALALPLLLSAAARAADWPQFQHDPQHSGRAGVEFNAPSILTKKTAKRVGFLAVGAIHLVVGFQLVVGPGRLHQVARGDRGPGHRAADALLLLCDQGESQHETPTLAARPHLCIYGNVQDEFCPARMPLNTKLPMRLFS